MLKIISQTENEEDWSSAHNNNEVDDVSYSMVEDNAKKNLIDHLKSNLENEPAIITKQNS